MTSVADNTFDPSSAQRLPQLSTSHLAPGVPNPTAGAPDGLYRSPLTPPPTPIISDNGNGEKLTVSAKHLQHHTLQPEFISEYTLGDELGSGGFGFVVSATRKSDHKEVAVKFIFRDKVPVHGWAKDPELGVIPMEVYVLRNVQHPNIISFMNVYQDFKFFYLVMELHGTPWSTSNPLLNKSNNNANNMPTHSGSDNELYVEPPKPALLVRRTSCDLFECIEHHSKFSESQARMIFKQIVECVDYLNSRGICHRDIKDENIVIDNDFRVKLIDFGSAVIIPRPQGKLFDRFYGTINYASPEILKGEKYRAESAEIWSLGILLYTILYGEVPFNDPVQAISGPYIPPRVRSSAECLHLLNWMLAKTPERRATIEDVVNHPWISGLSLSA
ncbi:MAG: kinase-like domain-containing protein [Linnemannia elongata]|nr:MAG: kinase-like domain-containing protein [Linnemannia elongata]